MVTLFPPAGGVPSRWGPIDAEQHKASAAGSPEVVELGPVPEGLTWVLGHVAVEDETNGFTSVRLAVADSLSQRPVEYQGTGTAGVLYPFRETIVVPAGKRLQARFVGSTSGDKLALYANGYWVRA